MLVFFLKLSGLNIKLGLFLKPVVWLIFYLDFMIFSDLFGGLKLLNLHFYIFGLFPTLKLGFVEYLCFYGIYFKLYIIEVDWNLLDFLEELRVF